jgi:hypothetical protein
MKPFVCAALVWFAALCLVNARAFDVRRDTFPFANETAWAYGVDEAGQLHISTRDTPARYAHRCFVLTRAVLQFHQFARFAPERSKVPREEYRRLIRAVCRIPVWSKGPRERLVIPGFPDLRAFSVAYEGLLKENLGNWFPTYVRPGNYRMAMGHPRSGQAMVARWLAQSLAAGRIRTIYLARFPHLNHAVVAYAVQHEPGGDLRFLVYDPNYPAALVWLRYRAPRRSFEFQKRWYFPGGQVNAMRIYLSPLH